MSLNGRIPTEAFRGFYLIHSSFSFQVPRRPAYINNLRTMTQTFGRASAEGWLLDHDVFALVDPCALDLTGLDRLLQRLLVNLRRLEAVEFRALGRRRQKLLINDLDRFP